MRARYYVPSIGRFIAKDPIGLVGGLNLYVYVGGNPINFIDPRGLVQEKQPLFKIFSSSGAYFGVVIKFIKFMVHKVHHGKGIHCVVQIFRNKQWKTLLEIRNLFRGVAPIFLLPPEVYQTYPFLQDQIA